MAELVVAALFGGIGGALRALVGISKSLKKKQKPNLLYFIITPIIAVIFGIVAGLLLPFDERVALVVGYAGTDVLEGIAKIFRGGKAWGLLK